MGGRTTAGLTGSSLLLYVSGDELRRPEWTSEPTRSESCWEVATGPSFRTAIVGPSQPLSTRDDRISNDLCMTNNVPTVYSSNTNRSPERTPALRRGGGTEESSAVDEVTGFPVVIEDQHGHVRASQDRNHWRASRGP